MLHIPERVKHIVRTLLIAFCWFFSLSGIGKEIPLPLYGGISMPSGWDDSIIDRLKAGKTAKMTVAVMDFEGGDKLLGKVDVNLSEMLATALVRTNKFDMIERNKIEKVIAEQNFQMSGAVNDSSAVEVGKLVGAEAVVLGSVTSVSQTKVDKFAYDVLKTEIGVDVRVVSVTTGEIRLSESAVGTTENKLITTADGTIVNGAANDNSGYSTAARSAIDQVGKRIADLNVPIGFVVDIPSKDRITIDLGEDSGILPKSRFVVFRVLDEIVHPVTGKHLGWKKLILCEIEIESTEKSMSVGKIVDRASEEKAKPGDYVIFRKSSD
jgi:curli biogenesis system outer membrane secretion channel CsgG